MPAEGTPMQTAAKMRRLTQRWSLMPEAFTKVSLATVDDAAPGNGFGDRWEARVARVALEAERTGVALFRLLPRKRSPFTSPTHRCRGDLCRAPRERPGQARRRGP